MAIYLRNEQGQFAYLNHPTLKGDKGEKGEKGDRGEQGLPGKNGRDGITPSLQVGSVTTLEPEQQATVTIGGTKENPVLDFGIPKGQSGKKLIAKYVHNANKTVQPVSLNFKTGIFTCDSPHNLTEGKQLYLRYDYNTAPANIPIELYNINLNQWGRGRLKAHIINEFSFQVYKNNGEYLLFPSDKNVNVDVSKFSFEYDLKPILIDNINCSYIDFYCNGFITGGYFSMQVNEVHSRDMGQSTLDASTFGQVSCYISYTGTANFVEDTLTTHANLFSKTINHPSYVNYVAYNFKNMSISYKIKSNPRFTNIKNFNPASSEVFPLNGFIVEIWGGE